MTSLMLLRQWRSSLADAIRAIEATDPTEIQSRLKELASSLEQHGTQSFRRTTYGNHAEVAQ